jgi:hypothetical protein
MRQQPIGDFLILFLGRIQCSKKTISLHFQMIHRFGLAVLRLSDLYAVALLVP